MSHIKTKYSARNIEFQFFWLKVGNRVGSANLPLVMNAENVQEFISDIDSQSNPLREVIQTCYLKASCTSLQSEINPFLVMDVLGECLYKQKHHFEPDVSMIDLFEHIGLYISQEFITKPLAEKKVTIPAKDTLQNSTAAIINFTQINRD